MSQEREALHKAVDAALKELSRVVHLAYEPSTPNDRRITEVAKAICQAKRQDPHHIVTGHPGVPCMAGNDAIAIIYPIQPAWATYWQEAAAAIDAVDRPCVQG